MADNSTSYKMLAIVFLCCALLMVIVALGFDMHGMMYAGLPFAVLGIYYLGYKGSDSDQ